MNELNLMAKAIEFQKFYRLLREVINGNEEKNQELEWMLAEYEHAKDADCAFDELGQIFCHHGVMELYEYTGVDDIQYINQLEIPVWEYLKKRTKVSLSEYMLNSMISHANTHQLAKKISKKWETDSEEIEENMEDLAKYVVEGIIELINRRNSII